MQDIKDISHGGHHRRGRGPHGAVGQSGGRTRDKGRRAGQRQRRLPFFHSLTKGEKETKQFKGATYKEQEQNSANVSLSDPRLVICFLKYFTASHAEMIC